ncbi:MAG: ISKra4 family transposase [Deltaproteobacteria bacterium]|nr:ISKra4 family transposase [Deltaproteobacteria bacterium]
MGAAAVISLAEVRERRQRAEFRRQLHECLDDWLDALEEKVKEPKPTLEQLTRVVWELRQELTGSLTEALLGQRWGAEQEQTSAPCPHCGRPVAARGVVGRTLQTLVGEMELSRPYFYCVPCGQGFAPLDNALGLAPGHKQFDVHKAVARLTAEVPYETACELFAELTGLKQLRESSAHTLTNEIAQGVGVLEVAPSREEIWAKVAQVAAGKRRRPIMVLAIDGAYVPTRPETAKGGRPGRKKKRAKRALWQGEWREAKGFRFYLVDEERIEHILSWHQIGEDEELFWALKQVKEAGLIPEEQVRLCVVADGAHWIWLQVQELFPTACEILDYYHCSEHIHTVAAAQYGEQPEKTLEWIEATMARLFMGEVDRVIGGLKRMQPATVKAGAEINNLITYLQNNRHRVHYGSRRKGGYPLSSGGIESAHKFICHVRLKRSGAWWYVANGNHMLALRCAKYNGTFERVFERYQQKVLEKSRQKSVKK